MVLFVVSMMAKLILCGGMVAVASRLGLDQTFLRNACPLGGLHRGGINDQYASPDTAFNAHRIPALAPQVEDLAVQHGHASCIISMCMPILCGGKSGWLRR
ncbi:hypothetical protein [Mycobacterium leprae]|uniref:hypothetical protein n=1 Tax=Mycobacterium leprae TaxID=1769 RepID=UPI0002F3A2A3|nr:hypothetical protein [Mycobacterium leprae]